MVMHKRIICLLALLGIGLCCAYAAPVKANITQCPLPGAVLQYTGTSTSLNLTIQYYAWNATCLRSDYLYYSGSTLEGTCQYIESISNGLIVNASYVGSATYSFLTFKVGCHTIRGDPQVLTVKGDTQNMAMVDQVDVTHTIQGSGFHGRDRLLAELLADEFD